MSECKRLRTTDMGALLDQSRRQPVFLRISAYRRDMEPTLLKLFEQARQCGVVLEGKIPNPTEDNLAYYYEMMGQSFSPDLSFVSSAIAKWLPRMKKTQQEMISRALLDTLMNMRRQGKTDSMLRNAYIRFMCWLYFKFERVAIRLGEGRFPLVLYQGTMTGFELNFLTILCDAGCDVAVIQCEGDAACQKLDPANTYSDAAVIPQGGAFPPGFSITALYKASLEQQRRASVPARPQPAPPRPQPAPPRPQPAPPRPQPAPPRSQPAPPRSQPQAAPDRPLALPNRDFVICPNIWMKTDTMDSILLPNGKRGEEAGYLYTCFVRREGVEDRLTYPQELMTLYQRLMENHRRVMIVDEGLAQPTPEEIQNIRRRNYTGVNDAIMDLAGNLRSGTALELHNTLVRAFSELMKEEADRPGVTVQRIVNTGIFLLCWFQRCYKKLLTGWKKPEIGCLIWLGACTNEREALFLRFLSRLPVDVLLLCPDKAKSCMVADPLLLVQPYSESLDLKRFPREGASMRISTAASNAEQELNGTLYAGSGLYRNRQFDFAQSVLLESTCDEISLYWDQELKYRPGFNTVNGTVMMPVLFAQVNGVRNGDVGAYWLSIKPLLTADTVMFAKPPYYSREEGGPALPQAAEIFRDGKLQRTRLKEHRGYPFAFLREETQEHILNKLQLLIDQKLIRGTFENGTEYLIISTILGMKKEWLRRIQKFDFTKKNPKVVCIHTEEKMVSREDAIFLAFLSLIGFDVVGYVPTGYQWVGQWYAADMLVDHQNGDYVYDLRVPDFNTVTQTTHSVWNIFRRGS